jgi:hypothetical protein
VTNRNAGTENGRRIRVAFVAALILLGAATSGFAQTPERDEVSGIRAFVHNVGETIYGLAWPTAKFKGMSVSSVRPVVDGFDVVVKLTGESMWGGELWLKLGMEFRNDGLDDLLVLDHNALLFKPFETVTAFGMMLNELANEYERSQGRAAVGDALCIGNPTAGALKFQYRLGNGAWTSYEVPAYTDAWFSRAAGGAGDFFIRFDDSFADGYSERGYRLEFNRVALPVKCQTARRYKFAVQGSSIDLLAN